MTQLHQLKLTRVLFFLYCFFFELKIEKLFIDIVNFLGPILCLGLIFGFWTLYSILGLIFSVGHCLWFRPNFNFIFGFGPYIQFWALYLVSDHMFWAKL